MEQIPIFTDSIMIVDVGFFNARGEYLIDYCENLNKYLSYSRTGSLKFTWRTGKVKYLKLNVLNSYEIIELLPDKNVMIFSEPFDKQKVFSIYNNYYINKIKHSIELKQIMLKLHESVICNL